jgi:hypothetical protein
MAALSEDDLRKILGQGRGMAQQPVPSEQVRHDSSLRTALFRELMNFSYQRSALQAFGWYLIFELIAWVLFYFVLLHVVTDFHLSSLSQVLQWSRNWGPWLSALYAIVLAIPLLWSRWRRLTSILLASVAILLSLVGGLLFGLVPLAVLTTRPSNKSRKEIIEAFE